MVHSLQVSRFIFMFLTATWLRTAVSLEPGCAKPLGLIYGSIADWQISASSASPDSDAQPKYGRLYAPPGHAWCANARADNGHHWLLVDLGVDTWVAGLVVQGREGYEYDGDGAGANNTASTSTSARTTAFSISYANAGASKGSWTYVEDVYGVRKVFEGNIDGATRTRTVWLEEVLRTRFIRVHLLEWVGAPCIRLELLGCPECSSIVSGPGSGTRITASTSSAKYNHHDRDAGGQHSQHLISCQPENGLLESHSGWCPTSSNNDVHQWLQFEFSAPTLVTGIVTRGHGHGATPRFARRARISASAWVMGYTLSYSNDSASTSTAAVWFTYRDAHAHHGQTHAHAHAPKVFGGNMDRDTERRHFLNAPVAARVVRLHPLHWHGTIGMRAGIIGCPAQTLQTHGKNHHHHHDHIDFDIESCPEGYFRLNPLAPCFENLAWRREVWTNDKKHFWAAHEWKHGHVSRAVNPESNETRAKVQHRRGRSLSQCAVLDNYYTEEPVWMVDLGRRREVSGVVIGTWQGEDDGESVRAPEGMDQATRTTTTYRDYVAGLEEITVYVSNVSRVDKLDEHEGGNEATGNSKSCGTITRENNAIFASKLFYECSHSRSHAFASARYVYVKPKPALLRWTRIFNFVICQVFVY